MSSDQPLAQHDVKGLPVVFRRAKPNQSVIAL